MPQPDTPPDSEPQHLGYAPIDDPHVLAKAVACLAEGVLITDDELDPPGPRIVFVNEAMCRITGYSREELLGHSPRVLQTAGTDRSTLDHIRSELSSDRALHCQVINRRKDGTQYDAELIITPVFDDAGMRTNFVSVHRDVTQRNRERAALRRNEEQLRAILNTAADAIVTIDRQGTIVDLNPAVERMFGYASEELLDRNVNVLMPSPEREEHTEYLSRYLETREPRIIGIGRVVSARKRDGSTFPVELSVSEVNGLGLFTGIMRDVTDRRRLERDVLETAEAEQQRIAQELHDGVGQELAGVAMMAGTLAALLERDGAAATDRARKLADDLATTNQHVRELARGLFPIEVDAGGLAAAVTNLARRIRDTVDVDCSARGVRPLVLREARVATHLYRIAQEATANALRHGQPASIDIVLDADERRVRLEIRDDGCGFDLASVGGGGLGLRTMRYRAELMSGHLNVRPRTGGGTVVCCTLPARVAQHEAVGQ